jgi:hypothetical protein
MDEKAFKKHLAALWHGHHHAEEHDWPVDVRVRKAPVVIKPLLRSPRAKPSGAGSSIVL